MRYYCDNSEFMATFRVVSFRHWTRGMWRRLLRDHEAERSLDQKRAAIKRWMWIHNIREYRYRVQIQ